MSSYQILEKEAPGVFDAFGGLIKSFQDLPGLDKKTKQLIRIACLAMQGNAEGAHFHAVMAREAGATRQEVISAVVLTLSEAGLSRVLAALPSVIAAYKRPADSGTA